MVDDVYASHQVYDLLNDIFSLPASAGEAIDWRYQSSAPLQKSKREKGKLRAGWDLYPSNRSKVMSLMRSKMGAKWSEGLVTILTAYRWTKS